MKFFFIPKLFSLASAFDSETVLVQYLPKIENHKNVVENVLSLNAKTLSGVVKAASVH